MHEGPIVHAYCAQLQILVWIRKVHASEKLCSPIGMFGDSKVLPTIMVHKQVHVIGYLVLPLARIHISVMFYCGM